MSFHCNAMLCMTALAASVVISQDPKKNLPISLLWQHKTLLQKQILASLNPMILVINNPSRMHISINVNSAVALTLSRFP